MPTTHRTAQARAFLAATALCLILTRQMPAQAAASPVADRPEDQAEEETITLSPFVVDASEDAGSYRANSTLAGTRVRTDLKDVAASISVVTKQFLQDTGARNNEDLLVYTPNTQVGGVLGNFSATGGGAQFAEDNRLARPQQATRVRGLDAADNTRDYFLSEIPFDSYNVDRVDLQRGPNSVLFGVGSPAGIINASINTATFKNANKVETRFDARGSARFSVDFNRVLIPKTLAIRVAALSDETKYQQKPAFNNDHRLFGAAIYEPHLFEAMHGHTSFRVNFEQGDISADRPRLMPPLDCITPWFLTGTTTYQDANGHDVVLANPNKKSVSVFDDIDNLPEYKGDGVNTYPVAYIYPKSNPGRVFWPAVLARYDLTNSYQSSNSNSGAPTLVQMSAPYASYGINAAGQPDNGIDGLGVAYPSTIAGFHTVAQHLIPGGNNYSDVTLSDPSVFDFFNKLIDGRNSYQWQKWHAANFAASQSFFDERLALQYVYDMQRYADGRRDFLGSTYDLYRLCIDINTDLPDGSPNPNFGRPYVSNSFEKNNTLQEIARDSHRLTLTGELRASDLLGRTTLASILGRQVFTGLLSQDTKRTHVSGWSSAAAGPEFARLINAPATLTGHNRDFDYLVYLGDSLANASTASGANLKAVDTIIAPPSMLDVQYFDNNWARSTNPADPNYVDPAAPYHYVNAKHQPVDSTQSENPANYGGWKTTSVNFLNADQGDRSSLLTGDSKVFTRIKSRSFTWQAYLLDDAFVPVFSWRRDEINTRTGTGTQDALGVINPYYDYSNDPVYNQTAVGETKSWGGVLHLPKRWVEKMPLGTDISVFYNRSANFKADTPRGDLFGNQLPNPTGNTKEYGFGLSTLHDKVTLKVAWYETHVANATLDGGTLGSNGYMLWAVPTWGTAFAANVGLGLEGKNDGGNWMWQHATNGAAWFSPEWWADPAIVKEKAAIEAWKDLPLDQSFFNAYGNEVAVINVAALRAGDWAAADPLWNVKQDNQPSMTGLAGFAGGPVIAVDTQSRGQEYELSAQPTKNWNITVNASKTFASRDAIAPEVVAYIQTMSNFLAGPAGDIAFWGSTADTDTTRWHWQNEVVIPYETLVKQEGSNVPEQAPWAFNAVSTYNFDQGFLSGAFLGGGYRWEDRRVLGYELLPDKTAIDVTKPLYGPTDSHVDLWVGYKRKISPRINWRIQVNLRNVGENTRLVPVTLQPDGSPGYSRIQGGTEYQLTNTFEF